MIEECISILEPTVQERLPKDKQYLVRWICLKLMDGDEKILASISKNLKIPLLEDVDIGLKLIGVKAKLSNENISGTDSFRDQIVSSIVFEAETLSSDVCNFSNSTYNERDCKIDKILTSKKFGIPIMIAFLGLIFWITIIGANYPSSLLSSLFAWMKNGVIWMLQSIHSPRMAYFYFGRWYIYYTYLGNCCNATADGYFLSTVYFNGRFRVFA